MPTRIQNNVGRRKPCLPTLPDSCFTLSWACVKEVNPHALSGMATSVANTGAFLGTGILQPLVGRSIDLSGSYTTGL